MQPQIRGPSREASYYSYALAKWFRFRHDFGREARPCAFWPSPSFLCGMDMNIETALRKLRNQTALMSWAARLAVHEGEWLPEGAAAGLSDLCDDVCRLAAQVTVTLDATTLDLQLVDASARKEPAPKPKRRAKNIKKTKRATK